MLKEQTTQSSYAKRKIDESFAHNEQHKFTVVYRDTCDN